MMMVMMVAHIPRIVNALGLFVNGDKFRPLPF